MSPRIGILMAMGIAAGNSIIEYAPAAKKERDMSRFEALLGTAHRGARPVVMTSTALTGRFTRSTSPLLARIQAPLLAERSGAGGHATATPGKDPGHAHPQPVSFVG
ncbi:hypothetical protein [Mesorhizobium shangrilense]|uniref:Uncharacterized protein n=1 Tax=Mesorhizobium shangrilense TaxID=460060 RepID=A0ABV2DHS8_9HYPH